MEDIVIKPIGTVSLENKTKDAKTLILGVEATVRLLPELKEAMDSMEESQYFWIMCWLDKAERNLLQVRPYIGRDDGRSFGVFNLRTPVRPNPISLSLVKLISIEGTDMIVSGLDVYDGTPVLDIKPYVTGDVIFAPQTLNVKKKSDEFRGKIIAKEGFQYHGEKCGMLAYAVRMAMYIENQFDETVTSDCIKLEVGGDLCLADALQGIAKAKLANPPRFVYKNDNKMNFCTWYNGDKAVKITVEEPCLTDFEEIMNTDIEKLFNIKGELKI